MIGFKRNIATKVTPTGDIISFKVETKFLHSIFALAGHRQC